MAIILSGEFKPSDPMGLYRNRTNPLGGGAPAGGGIDGNPTNDFNTPLTDAEEKAFTAWKAKYAPEDTGEDYDLRGAFKAGLSPDPENGHFSDAYKKPNHPTFSMESRYAQFAPDLAGSWDEAGNYVPSEARALADATAAAEQQTAQSKAAFDQLEAKKPGRYQLISAGQYDKWKAEWEKKNRSDGIVGDTVRLLDSGVAGLEQSLNEMIGQIPVIGKPLQDFADTFDKFAYGSPGYSERMQEVIDRNVATLTPEMAAARSAEWWDSEKNTLGSAWLNPRSYFAGVVESLPSMAATMAPAMWLARGAYLGAIAKGATEKVAAAAAAKTALVAGAVAEGGLGGAETAKAVRDRVAQIPREKLLEAEAVKALISQGMSPDEAVAAITDDAATQAFVIGGVATGVFGGFGDQFLAKILAEGVGGTIGKRIAQGALRGVVAEGLLEELPQEGLGQVAQNVALANTVNPGQDLTEGVANAALGGAAIGGVMGAGLGGAGGALRPAEAPVTDTGPEVIAARPAPVSPGPAPAPAPRGPLASAVEHGLANGMDEVPVSAPVAATTEIIPDAEPVPVTPVDESSAPEVGSNVVVEIDGFSPFTGRVDSYEQNDDGSYEAVVVNGDGEVLQVPLETLRTAKLTDQMIEQMDAPPAVDRPMPDTDPEVSRDVGGSRMVLPDPVHAQLYDFGHQRKVNKGLARTLGEDAIKANQFDPQTRKAIADAFSIPEARVNELADDYRYRVEKAAKTKGGKGLPQNMHAVSTQVLQRFQIERLKAEKAAAEAPTAEPDFISGTGQPDEKMKSGGDLAPLTEEEEQAIWRKAEAEMGETAYPDVAEDYADQVVEAARQERLRQIEDAREAARAPTGKPSAKSIADKYISAPTIDAPANAAATSPKNDLPEPTQAQKEAGNYQLGHFKTGGLDISIENPAGSERKGVDKGGKAWSVQMKHHYGYIKGTTGRDKDHIDVFVNKSTGELADSAPVFVVDQVVDGKFDEHKVMLGYKTADQASRAYRSNYTKGWKGLGAITETTLGEFKAWLRDGNTRQEFAKSAPVHAAEFADVPEPTALQQAVADEEERAPTPYDWQEMLPADVRDLLRAGNGLEPAVGLVKADADDAALIKSWNDTIGASLTGMGGHRTMLQARGKTLEVTMPIPDGSKPIKDVFKGARLAQLIRDAVAIERDGEQTFDDVPEPTALQYAIDEENAARALPNGTAPEHTVIGVDDRQLTEIVGEFNAAQAEMMDGNHPVSNIFEKPNKGEIVRLAEKVKVYNKDHGWMTPAEAKAKIDEWKAHALAQGQDPASSSANGDKVVLSLFDLSGQWSRPWEEAGYQVYRFDIQDDPVVGDVNNFSTEFFGDWFGDFDGLDVYAILAACPCTDFAVSGARHFAAKDADGRTVASVKLVHQTLRAIEYFKPAVWALENPVGRIQELGGLPPWRLSFDPNHIGDPYTKKTLIWGRFNADLPIAPVEPTEGSKMWKQYGGKSMATKNARSVTPEGFAYGFFMANNALDHAAMAVANKFDRLDRSLIEQAIDAGVAPDQIQSAVEDFYYMDLDDQAANDAIRGLIPSPSSPSSEKARTNTTKSPEVVRDIPVDSVRHPLRDEIGKHQIVAEKNAVSRWLNELPQADYDLLSSDYRGRLEIEIGNSANPLKLLENMKGELQAAKARTKSVKSPEVVRDIPVDTPAADPFAGNKLFTADKVAAAKARLKSKMGQLNSGIDPEVLIDGMTIAGAYIEAGVRNFADYAKQMSDDFGDRIKPYLLSFWEGARNYPGLDTKGMTPADESARLFAEINKVLPVEEAPALGVELATPKKKTRKTGSPADRTLIQDFGVEYIDGWAGEGEETDFGIKGGVKDNFLADAMAYLRAVASQLEAAGYTPAEDTKGRPMKAVSKNESGVAGSGDVSLTMWHPESGVRAYVHIAGTALRGSVPTTPSGISIMFRVGVDTDRTVTRGYNQWAPVDLSAADFAGLILRQAERAKPRGTPLSTEDKQRAIEELKAVVARPHLAPDTETADDAVPTVESAGRGALEAVPADPVPPAQGKRETRRSADRGDGADLFGDVPARGERDEPGRGVPAGAREVPVPAGGSDSVAAEAVKAAKDTPVTPAANLPADYAISDADEIGSGGAKTKFRNNVAAIKVLRALRDEDRPARRDEQGVLAKWVGWGGLSAAFPHGDGSINKGWEKEAAELKALLTPEEYRAAESSTRNAHYTAPEVVTAIWDIAKRLGFRGGLVLEPSVGAGNFIGLMPPALRKGAKVTGVELDAITGAIAKNLYPSENIHPSTGFQDFSVPNDYFDLAIGNPPFGSEKLFDRERKELSSFSIHNYFFAKSVEALKPGGVLAMVVTNYFLDAAASEARQYIGHRATLVGAIRLPNNAFLKNAGTEVTTDIIILRKLMPGEEPNVSTWGSTGTFTDKNGKKLTLSRYFMDNPDMMLGEFGAFGTMYRGDEAALVARPGDKLPELLAEAIQKLPTDIMAPPADITPPKETVAHDVGEALVGSLFLTPEGAIMERLPDSLGEKRARPFDLDSEKARERVAGMIRVRDVFARLRRAQIDANSSDEQIATLRERLNKAYDAFVSKNGPINSDANKRLFRDDPTWPQIAALEEKFDKGISEAVAKRTGETPRAPSAQKAPIFTRRTQAPYQAVTVAKSAKDALAATLSDLGRVDLDHMHRLYGKPVSEIVRELGTLLYKEPGGAYVTADDYLSGNVKQKLALAEAALAEDPEMARNIAALKDVIPADIEAVDIDVKPGAPWIPSEFMVDFINHLIEGTGSKAKYLAPLARWSIETGRYSAAVSTLWGTSDVTVDKVVEAAINDKPLAVYHKNPDGSQTLDQSATDAANEKVEKAKREFRNWVWTDDHRREVLARIYNDTYNTTVARAYDGSHLKLPGKISDDVVTLRPHQLNYIWRGLQTGTILADHTVGAGKTFAQIALIMEKRRTGQARKPMLVVPNHLVGQWAADFIKLYPGAKVLAATKRDFEAENRKKFFARVATGDWDCVIVAHSSFGRIPVDPEYEARFIQQQIDDIELSIDALREEEGQKSRNIKQITKARDALSERLKRLLDAGRKDDGLTFDEMGVDFLGVDEAHEFKNLGFATSMRKVAGLGNTTGSQKAADLYMKVTSVLERTGGRNVSFLTGTPLSNTMAEMFTMLRYLAYSRLKDLGITHFDAWAKVFGEVVTDWELSPSGTYKLNSRFAKFVNIPELMQLYRSFADVITNDDIKAQLAAQGKTLPLPKVKGGKPTIVVVPRSNDQALFIGTPIGTDHDGNDLYPKGSLVWRAENLPKKVEKGSDNMLKVMSDARKAALDMRLIDPNYSDVAGSKVHEAASHIKRLYDKWHRQLGTQLVFIDLSTPKKAMAAEEKRLRELIAKAEEGDDAAQTALDNMSPDEFLSLNSKFSVYDDLRDKLVALGIPPAEIAFIHDANTEIQKEELFGKVRSGRVRVLFGSTPKMGAGTNVQNRLVALHHLDAPWRPSDLEQRDGRGIRQGNELYALDPDGFEIEIMRYATEKTLDARQWQGIEAKARFIAQVRKGTIKDRVVEDISGEAANAAEMKAAASGNPLILEEIELKQKIRKLEGAQTEHDRGQHRVRSKIRDLEQERGRLATLLPAQTDDARRAEALDSSFQATIAGQPVEKAKEFGAAIISEARDMREGETRREIGRYGEFNLALEPSYLVKSQFTLTVEGALEYSVNLGDVGEADAVGTGMRVRNLVSSLASQPDISAERTAEITRQIPALEKQIGDWDQQEQLEGLKARHQEVLAVLKPKPKTQQAAPAPSATEGVKASIADVAPYARSGNTRTTGKSVRAELDESPFGSIVSKLIDAGRVRIVNGAPRGVPEEAQAWTEFDGRITLNAAMIEPGEAVALLLHEAFHSGAQSLLGDAKWKGLQRELTSLHKQFKGSKGRAREFYDAARQRLAEAQDVIDIPDDLTAEEFAAYAIEEYEAAPPALRKWVDDLVGAIKAWLLRRFGAQIGEVTPAELRAIAAMALGDAAGGQLGLRASIKAPPVDSEAFRRWFGPSKVVDAAGAPLIVYHGTPKNFEAFDPGKLGRNTGADDPGIFFTSSREVAEGFRGAGLFRKGRVIETYLSMKKPRIVDGTNIQAGSVAKSLILNEAVADGFDGVIFKNLPESDRRGLGEVRSDVYVVFNPTQIKAVDNVGTFDPSNPRIRASIKAPKAREVVQAVAGSWTDIQPKLLATVPLTYFAELARPTMTAVKAYLQEKRSMDAYRGHRHAMADELAQDWLKFSRLGAEKTTALSSLMHDATLAGVDPSKTDENTRLPGYEALRARFLALPKTGQSLFERVRDSYVEQTRELDRLILETVRKSQEIGRKKAQEAYEAEVERIRNAGLEPFQLKEELDRATDRHAKDMLRSFYANKARLTQLRKVFESNKVPAPYFPLARFGRYTVTVRAKDGSVVSFSRREKAADNARLAREMAAEYPQYTVEAGVIDEAGAGHRDAMDPRMVAEIQKILGDSGVDPSVMDAIWQRYLQSMPDLSTRKRFIHRKGTAGFEGDALRAYSSHMFHAAHQMARLKYGVDLQEMLDQAAIQARKSDDPTRGSTLVNELAKRHKWVMNPTGSAAVQSVTSAMFVWYLAASPAAALVNLTQTPMLGIPIIGARFGMAKTSAALLKASRDFIKGKGTVGQSDGLTVEERNVMSKFYETGLIDRTQSHDLAGVGDTGVTYSPLRAKVMAIISWGFHKTEVANREVTALAAYRLARGAGLSVEAAIDAAHDLTWKVHFDYANSSRPRLLQGDAAKLLLVFQNYQINMWYRLFRDIHQAFKGESPAARKEARYQLAGMVGMMTLMGGVSGIFGFHVLMAILGLFFDDRDDPYDFEAEMRRNIINMFGPDVGGMILNGVPGKLLNIDLTSRIGMPDFFIRTPDRADLEGREWWQQFIVSALGVVPSTIINFGDGFGRIGEGNVMRGLELMAPKAIKDVMQAYRFMNEGVTTRGGDDIVPKDQLDAWNLITRMIGFTPAEISEAYERNGDIMDAQTRIMDVRSTLLKQLAMAIEMGDEQGKQAVLERIRRFNAIPTHRGVAITGDTVKRSLAARRRNSAKRLDGVLIQNEQLGHDLRALQPARING